jgi:hypothetical protein
MGFENVDWQTACRPGITKAFLEHIMVEYQQFLLAGGSKGQKRGVCFHVSAVFRVLITSKNSATVYLMHKRKSVRLMTRVMRLFVSSDKNARCAPIKMCNALDFLQLGSVATHHHAPMIKRRDTLKHHDTLFAQS